MRRKQQTTPDSPTGTPSCPQVKENTKIPLSFLRQIQSESTNEAWTCLFQHAWDICSQAISTNASVDEVASQIAHRDYALHPVDQLVATAFWDLWKAYESSVTLTSQRLVQWWNDRATFQDQGRAVLVLDALSLREVPWLLQGAESRGYQIHQACATGAELPADTQSFALALGFRNRSELADSAHASHGLLSHATTDTTDIPFSDCAAQVASSRDILIWHHWPDDRVHSLASPGRGILALAKETAEQLTSEGFWSLIHALTQGRRLIVTADHGYAASGNFPNVDGRNQSKSLADRYKAQRFVTAEVARKRTPKSMNHIGGGIPLDLRMTTRHDDMYFVLGRRQWRIHSGYPTLTHGGLSLLEVAVPFVELSRRERQGNDK